MPVNSNLVAERELITLLLANLPREIGKAACSLPNTPFTTPNGKPWIRATVNPFGTQNTVATGHRQRTRGVLTLSLLYPKGSLQQPMIAAEALKQTFSNTATNSVMLYEVEIIPRGDDESWYHVQIDINYAHEGFTHA